MVESHTYVVPFTFVEECDTTALTSLRERVNAELDPQGRGEAQRTCRSLAKALLHGFAKYPELNALMDEEKQALVVKKDVNLGFGAATGQGLTVFVVKDVRHRTVRGDRAGDRSARQGGARAQAAAVRSAGLDVHRHLAGPRRRADRDAGGEAPGGGDPRRAPHPGAFRWRPDGSIGVEIAERMNLSCSFDHRVIDGHIGAAFLYEVIHALEAPELLLMD